jgi:uroporphyrinogen decarboxylase
MTSRERVRAVLNGQLPDYIPNGLGGCETAGMHVLTYEKLRKILGLPKSPPMIDTFMSNAVFEQDVLQAMEGDILLLASPSMCRSEFRGNNIPGQWKELDLWGTSLLVSAADSFSKSDNGDVEWNSYLICPDGSYFFDAPVNPEIQYDIELPDPDNYNPPHEIPENKLRRLEKLAEWAYNETDYAICLGETLTDLQYLPGGYINGIILMKQEPELIKAFLNKAADASLAQLRLLNQAVGKYVDILSMAHDFSDNRGVIFGEYLWREVYKPCYKRLFAEWKKISGMKINLHCCGSV